jgi:hypothetical protein
MSLSWKKSLLTLALGLFILAPMASARGFVVARPYYGYGGWYEPYWGWGPSYYSGYPYVRSGEVKIVTPAKDAIIYVDGGYAGVTGKLKKFTLTPGNHNIELRDPSGKTYYQQRVHVILGKTVEIHPGG